MSHGRIGLIGDPVRNSISPLMHKAAFRATGLDLAYEAVRVRREELGRAFPKLRDRFAGLNVTRPLKEAVIPYLDRVGPKALRARSVNTIVFDDQAFGHSTDGTGFMTALGRAGVSAIRRAVVLGTGGAARAVAASLADHGAEVVVWGRNVAAGRRMRDELAVSFVPAGPEVEPLASALSQSELLVNATPVGGEADDIPLPSGIRLDPGTCVFDLVYDPRRTRLLREAEASGCLPVQGIEMLIEQGARSFELWTGREAPVEVMRMAAYRALDERATASVSGTRGRTS